jgi:hypothetical protein
MKLLSKKFGMEFRFNETLFVKIEVYQFLVREG